MKLVVVVQSLSCVQPLLPHGLQSARFLCLWDSPGNNAGVGCQLSFSKVSSRLNLSLLRCRQILYQLNCGGSLMKLPTPYMSCLAQFLCNFYLFFSNLATRAENTKVFPPPFIGISIWISSTKPSPHLRTTSYSTQLCINNISLTLSSDIKLAVSRADGTGNEDILFLDVFFL